VDGVGAGEVLVVSVAVDPELVPGAGEVLAAELVVWSTVGLGGGDDEVVDPVGAVEVLVDVVAGGGVEVVAGGAVEVDVVEVEVVEGGAVVVVGVVAVPDAVPVAADRVPLAVDVAV